MKVNPFATCLIILFPLAASQPSPYGFKVQFIGNNRYVSTHEEAQREFCENFWCTNDAEILFTRASQYKSSDPCVDFKNFSVGTALDVGAVNERYPYRGLISEVEFKFWERLRRILAEKIHKTENRVFKIAKNSFQRCVKSRHVLRHLDGHHEIVEYLQSLGGSPYLTRHLAWNPNLFNHDRNFGLFWPKNSSSLVCDFWNEENFEISRIFEAEPVDGLWFLLSFELQRCENGKILCLQHVSTAKWNKILSENVIEVLEYMNDNFIAGLYGKVELREKMFEPAMKNFREFSRMKENLEAIYEIEKNSNFNIQEDFNNIESGNSVKKSSKVIKIKNLSDEFEHPEIDWLELINNQLLKESKVDEDDFLIVEDFELLKSLIGNLKNCKKSITADYFTLSYLFLYQFIFTFHFDEDFVRRALGTKKSPQRWESCLIFNTVSYLQPALLLMYKNRYGNEGNSSEIEKFIKEIFAEARRKFASGSYLSLDLGIEIYLRLKNLKIETSFDGLSECDLDEFYAELNLNGDENFFESFLVIKKFNQKLEKEKNDSWRRKIEEKAGKMKISYEIDEENAIYIPPMWLIYPWYHPQRPRFFNMATMFIETLTSIHNGIKNYVIKTQNTSPGAIIITGLEDPVQIAFNHYKNFLKTNKDLQVGANFLTNLQLFYMARAVYHFSKYHRTVPEDMNAIQRLQIEFMHVEFKRKKGFQEAFECEMNESEWLVYGEYLKRFYEILEMRK